MGNCCSSEEAVGSARSDGSGGGGGGQASPSSSSSSSSRYYSAPAPTFSSGGRLGGDAVVAQLAPRDAAAMAAEARAAAAKPREDRLRREDLVGKLLEAHRRKGLSPPLNLASLPLAQLAAMNEQMGLRR